MYVCNHVEILLFVSNINYIFLYNKNIIFFLLIQTLDYHIQKYSKYTQSG